MESDWNWEVVTTKPSGHLRYHARLRMPNDKILLKTPDYTSLKGAYDAIRLARVHVLQASVFEVDET